MTATAVLSSLTLRPTDLLPWERSGDVATLSEYRQELGISERELTYRVAFGLPTLPPADGESEARVSRPHAQVWRALFVNLVEQLGGNGAARELGHEAERLRASKG